MSKITTENYQEFALRTLNNNYKSIAERLGTQDNVNKLHALLGIITEIQELEDAINNNDLPNIKEEIGDIFWFLSLLGYSDKIEKQGEFFNSYFDYWMSYTQDLEWKGISPEHSIKRLYRIVIILLDKFKSQIIYNKYDDNALCLGDIGIVDSIAELQYLLKYYNFNIEEVLQTNIDKLKTRFPDKFTEDKAQNRDLQKERGVLEG
jgi:NTP pyrophosphatase (non-canonical NTP hydrolase)